MAPDPTLAPSGDEKTRQRMIVANTLRATGAFFMIAGTVFGFNILEIPARLGLADGFTEVILGGVLFIVGVFDFVILPSMLEKKLS